jgi:hypothetical protein
MARRIVFADVGLGFDDHAGCDPSTRAMHEDLANQVGGDLERWPIEEGARERLA